MRKCVNLNTSDTRRQHLTKRSLGKERSLITVHSEDAINNLFHLYDINKLNKFNNVKFPEEIKYKWNDCLRPKLSDI